LQLTTTAAHNSDTVPGKLCDNYSVHMYDNSERSSQCFDTVGWMTGRASHL